jgi:hypothetical protein
MEQSVQCTCELYFLNYSISPPRNCRCFPILWICRGGQFVSLEHLFCCTPGLPSSSTSSSSSSSGSTSALKAYCAYPKLSSAQIQYPWVSYKETEVPEWGCAYIFWFHKHFPKNVVALSSQCLAAASNMLHCFSLHLAESAGCFTTKHVQWGLQMPFLVDACLI